jgi:hypothetical protein
MHRQAAWIAGFTRLALFRELRNATHQANYRQPLANKARFALPVVGELE